MRWPVRAGGWACGRGRGAVVDWLFADGGADCIIAGCDKDNVASVRTLRRLGFWLDSNPGGTFWWLITPQLRLEAARF